MTDNLFRILKSNDWAWVDDELIHIAKGKYELPTTRKERRKKSRWGYRILYYKVKRIFLSNKIDRDIRKMMKIK